MNPLFYFMGTRHYIADTFKPILFCNGAYQISRFGKLKRVYSINKNGNFRLLNTVLKLFVGSKQKYERHILVWHQNGVKHKKRMFIHRLVAEAFIPNPENKPCINHKDGNKLNNHVSNLEWCTVKENNDHAIEHGLVNSVPKETRDYIKANYNGYNKRQLAKQFNLSTGTIYHIGTNRDGRGLIKTLERVKYKIENPISKSKVVLNIETGEKFTAKQVSKILGFTLKHTYKILGEYEGFTNTTKYKYGEGYITNQKSA